MTEQKRKINKIVFQREPFKWGRFLIFTGVGLLLGLVFGGLLWFLMRQHAGEVKDVLYTKECSPYFAGSVVIGLLAGMSWGWGWKRPVQARVEAVDPPRERRRPTTTTAIARLDISGRSRF